MNDKFSIEMCSDLDFEGMVIDISYNMQTFASINYDKGIDKMEIEISPFGKDLNKTIFPLEDFLTVLEKAKKLAIRCAEEDSNRDHRESPS